MDTILGSNGSGPTATPDGDLIKDSNSADFGRDVMEVSMKTPVVVDFWAPWCGPCKQLGPLLEAAVRKAKGAVRMVKINVDQNQDLAAQLRIQSIPAVYAFFQGQPVDGFVGAQGEREIAAFVERLAKAGGGAAPDDQVAEALEQAEAALAQQQFGPASALFARILQAEPDNLAALAGMIRCYLGSGDLAGARNFYESLSDDVTASPEISAVKSALDLAEQSAEAGDVADLRARIAEDPKDYQARFDLALALQAAGDREAAAEELLTIIAEKRDWEDGKAREQLLKYFEAWGPKDPLTSEYRRRLSSLLFS
jgi:putative thioredoxin